MCAGVSLYTTPLSSSVTLNLIEASKSTQVQKGFGEVVEFLESHNRNTVDLPPLEETDPPMPPPNPPPNLPEVSYTTSAPSWVPSWVKPPEESYPTSAPPTSEENAPQEVRQEEEDIDELPLNSNRILPCNNNLGCILDLIAEKTPASDYRTVIVTILDDEYVPFFQNLMKSAVNVGISCLLGVTLSESAHNQLLSLGFPSYYYKMQNDVDNSAASLFKSEAFQRKTATKFYASQEVLKLGFSLLLLDLDNVFLQNPFSKFDCFVCDFEVQMDKPKKQTVFNICIGIVFMRPTAKMMAVIDGMFAQWKQHGENMLWDQELFINVVNTHSRQRQIRWRLLEFREFPSGFQLQEKFQEDGGYFNIFLYDLSDSYIFHANWFFGAEVKKLILSEFGLWRMHHPNYYRDPEAKYLSYSNSMDAMFSLVLPSFSTKSNQPGFSAPSSAPNSTSTPNGPQPYSLSQKDQLNAAFKIAATLNRILIFPKFAYNEAPAFCTVECVYKREAQDFLDTHRLFRPNYFFRSPEVPESVKKSTTPPISLSECENASIKGLVMTVAQVAACLQPYKDHSIIMLKDLFTYLLD
eukprot:Platyproteum_vivax@DN6367_c0_g1_i2.p1